MDLGYDNKSTISDWETGKRSPDAEKIIALTEYFDVSADYLLKGVCTAKEPTADTCKKCEYRQSYSEIEEIMNRNKNKRK